MQNHQILLMEYKGKLESVGLSNTAFLSDSSRKVVFQGGDPIIPISAIKKYAEEVEKYTALIMQLEEEYTNKDIKKAKKLCKKEGVSFSVLKD